MFVVRWPFTFWSSQESLCLIGTNLDMILLGWSSFKIVSGDMAFHSRWLPYLLIGWIIGNLWKSFSLECLDGMKWNLNQKVIEQSPSINMSADPTFHHSLCIVILSRKWCIYMSGVQSHFFFIKLEFFSLILNDIFFCRSIHYQQL